MHQSSPNATDKETFRDSGVQRPTSPTGEGESALLTGPGTSCQLRVTYCSNVAKSKNVQYHVNKKQTLHAKWRALVDRGANGCIAGSDMRIVEWTDRHIDLTGVDSHTVRNLRVGTFGGVVRTQRGEIIVIVHQAAHMSDGKTIISSPQAEHYKTKVNDKSTIVTGKIPHL